MVLQPAIPVNAVLSAIPDSLAMARIVSRIICIVQLTMLRVVSMSEQPEKCRNALVINGQISQTVRMMFPAIAGERGAEAA